MGEPEYSLEPIDFDETDGGFRSNPGIKRSQDRSKPLYTPQIQEATTYRELKNASETFGQSFARLSSQPKKLPELIGRAVSFARTLENLIERINHIPHAAENRPAALGYAMLPIVAATWSKHPPEDGSNASLLHTLIERVGTVNPLKDTPEGPHNILKGFVGYFSASINGEELPEVDPYLRVSEKTSAALQAIETELAEIEERLPKALVTTKLEERKEGLLKKKTALFESVTDVFAADIPEAMNGVDITVAAHPAVVSLVLQIEQSLEQLILYSHFASKSTNNIPEDLKLLVPAAQPQPKKRLDKIPISKAELAQIGKDPKQMQMLLQAYQSFRGTLRCLYGTNQQVPASLAKHKDAVVTLLQEPFASLGSNGQRLINSFMQQSEPLVAAELAKLVSEPVIIDAKTEAVGYLFEDPNKLSYFTWAMSQYLQAENESDAQRFHALMGRSDHLSAKVMGFADKVRGALESQDYASVIKIVNAEIDLFPKARDGKTASHDVPHFMGVLTVAEHLASNPACKQALKQRIGSIEEIKRIANEIGKEDESLRGILYDVVPKIVTSLSNSIDDYYHDKKDPDFQLLYESMEDFVFSLRHPEVLSGVRGTQILKNAAVIVGSPGAGKSYLVECIANQLGIERVRLRLKDKKSGESTIDFLTNFLKEIKDRAATKIPFLLEVDEAETLSPDRLLPGITREEREQTGVVLQEIEELLQDHPQIFIVNSTNYIERIDEAYLRSGRANLVIELDDPKAEIREQVLRGELMSEGIELELSETEWEALVKATDGLIINSIIQVIKNTKRIHIAKVNEQMSRSTELGDNSKLEFSYSLLKKRFEREQANAKKIAERAARRNTKDPSDLVA